MILDASLKESGKIRVNMLIDNALEVLKKAWSVRLIALSALFSALEVSVPFFTNVIPAGTLAGLALVSALGSAVMRVIYQPNLSSIPLPDKP